MWQSKTAQEAHDILMKPDVTVTNARDKAIQLPKILHLDRKVQQLFAPQPSHSDALMTA